MSVVYGETKLKNAERKIYGELDKIGVRVIGVFWNAELGFPEQATYHIGDSTVICENSEINEGFKKSSLTIIGKDHESVSKQISDILKQLGTENVNVKSVEIEDSFLHYEIPKLVKLGILKKNEHSI